jgi:hypothetical protein
MNLSWVINRVSSMSVPEVTFRLREQVRREMMRAASRGWTQFDAGTGKPPLIPNLRAIFLSATTPKLVEAINASVDSFLDGRFSALAQSWPRRPAGLEFPHDMWLVDPVTLKSWPTDRYCFDVNYKEALEFGDIKYVWQLNRLQFLPPLAAAAALGTRPQAGVAVRNILASWMSANEPFRGVCWNSGIELALRSVSVILAVSLCPEAITEAGWRQIRSFLAAHFYWLKRYPSRYSSANNHCVAEALAGYLIGSLMPELPGAVTHARASRDLLLDEALSQLRDDGTAAEQSLVYGAFTAEMVLTACLVGRCLGEEFPDEVTARLAKFADCISAFATASGYTPDIGDDDDTRVISLCHQRETRYCVSVARAISAYCGAPAPPMLPLEWELRDALFGRVTAERRPEQGPRHFPRGGYSIISEQRGGRSLKLVMDHGPLGYLSIAAHGHADANSFLLNLDDQPILVDPGTYLYHSGGAWRDWFRGTRAHSTLNIAGVNQSVITGPFNWGRKADAHLVSFLAEPNWALVAQHDGFLRRFGVIHQRRISALVDGILITDKLLPEGSGEPVEIVFQFAPGLDVSCSGLRCDISKGSDCLATVQFKQDGRLAVHCGEAESFLGWVSPAFGHRVPAPRLSWTGVLGADGLTTAINWLPLESGYSTSAME